MNLDTFEMLPTVVGPKGRLSEKEARIAGLTSTALINIRAMHDNCAGGGTIQTKGGTMHITTTDLQACFSLLIERGECLLRGLDIQLEHEGK